MGESQNHGEYNGEGMNEKDVLKQIRDYLKLRGYSIIRNQQNIGSMKGIADLTILRRGVVIFLEVKAPKGKQRPDQIIFQKFIEDAGGKYILAGSIDELMLKGI